MTAPFVEKKLSRYATGIAVFVVLMIICVAVAMISIISGNDGLALVIGILAVCCHLCMWRLMTLRRRLQGEE